MSAFIKSQLKDNSLHALWMFAVMMPFAIYQSTATFGLATLWWVPREFVDQWAGWPLSKSKKIEVAFWMLFSIVTTLIYHFS